MSSLQSVAVSFFLLKLAGNYGTKRGNSSIRFERIHNKQFSKDYRIGQIRMLSGGKTAFPFSYLTVTFLPTHYCFLGGKEWGCPSKM